MASPRMTIIRNLVNALRLASRPGGPSMVERLTALPRLARAVARGEYTGATTGRLLMMVGALGWLLSPIDLLPEAVLGVFGLVDDAMIASWLVAAVVTETEGFLGWERGIAAQEPAASPAATTVPGHVVG
ncbi:MAG: DUF1232 domain-containing protein [Actinobacteria bacterium]|nr:DUF1232 domain-containing protein [Actinomycetota bacterium]